MLLSFLSDICGEGKSSYGWTEFQSLSHPASSGQIVQRKFLAHAVLSPLPLFPLIGRTRSKRSEKCSRAAGRYQTMDEPNNIAISYLIALLFQVVPLFLSSLP